MEKSGSYSIRPAGRHILTIGSDLINDKYAAVIELVKNAFDADATTVNIIFKISEGRKRFSIIVSDDGHGMNRDVVINQWMVPSTDNKLGDRKSPNKRTMQGRKGIGRYSASILGNDLLLETTVANGEKTEVYIEWSEFEKAKYLEDVEILVDTKKVKEEAGTCLTINGDIKDIEEWNEEQFDKLVFELKKTISPFHNEFNNNGFDVFIEFNNFWNDKALDIKQKIETYPIVEFYDYRIAGTVEKDGKGLLVYSLQKARNTTEDTIKFEFKGPTGCGKLTFDIRVYDRESEAIESLIRRGLKHESGKYFSKTEAKQLITKFNGIGVYRNGFRIRPLGDADFDWLTLNKKRIQNPSLKIGSDQVMGYVQIQAEEQSDLIEKSARDGLKENVAYEKLKEITSEVINKLEIKRYEYRKKAGLSRPALKVERELERLFSFDEMKHSIKNRLTKGGVDQKTADGIIKIISSNEDDKNKIADEIRQTVAIYQGQATLGKIINVILHEGRRPLNYFKNQIPNLHYWCEAFSKTQDSKKLDQIIPIADGIGQNADVFVKLFSRLDPLASGKRTARKNMRLKKAIQDTFSVFEEEIKKQNVRVTISGPDKFSFKSWPQDIYSIFTNLIDNSIYWMCEKKSIRREINIELKTNGDSLIHIDYRDNGPGIESSHIISEVIFEPHFSTKPEGTGLGLAIAGEAAYRNGLELKAYESDTGAYFRLQAKAENEQ